MLLHKNDEVLLIFSLNTTALSQSDYRNFSFGGMLIYQKHLNFSSIKATV